MVIHTCRGWQQYIPHLLRLFFLEFLFCDDFIWYVSDVDADVFRLFEWGHELEV